jgi:hypothetical protein
MEIFTMDNTEPTIDKIIDELLAEAIEKAITEWAGQEYPNDATFYDVTVKEAKQAIKALIANQVAKARIEFAKSLKSIEYPPSGKEYHFNDGSWTNTLNGVKNK